MVIHQIRFLPALLCNSGTRNVSAMLARRGPAIEVLNLSAFPITISEAGFKLKGETGRLVPRPPFIFDNKPWLSKLASNRTRGAGAVKG